MDLVSKFTVKPLLIAVVALLVLLLVSNGGWLVRTSSLSAQRDVAKAESKAEKARADHVATERDAWKNKAGELATANSAAQESIASLTGELQKQQGENLRLQAEGEKAVAAAQADAADAERALKNFIDRYARQLRNPDCAGALSVVQQACPALEGY